MSAFIGKASDVCTCVPGSECVSCIKREVRALERQRYVRQHAPTILAGLVGLGGSTEYERLRKRAITEAGLLFDETEEP